MGLYKNSPHCPHGASPSHFLRKAWQDCIIKSTQERGTS